MLCWLWLSIVLTRKDDMHQLHILAGYLDPEKGEYVPGNCSMGVPMALVIIGCFFIARWAFLRLRRASCWRSQSTIISEYPASVSGIRWLNQNHRCGYGFSGSFARFGMSSNRYSLCMMRRLFFILWNHFIFYGNYHLCSWSGYFLLGYFGL